MSVLPKRGQARGDLFRREFGNRVERNRIAGGLLIEYRIPECAGAVSRRGRQVDDALDASAPRRDQDRRLSQQVDPQNGLGIARLALRTGRDRGSENDRLIARGDHLLDGVLIRDIALNDLSADPRERQNPWLRQTAGPRDRTASPHDRAPAMSRRYSAQQNRCRRKQGFSFLNPDPSRRTNHSSLAPKFCSGSISDTSRPVGFAASPPERARKRPEPASTERLPSFTMTRPRDSTVTGQPRSLRPAKGV